MGKWHKFHNTHSPVVLDKPGLTGTSTNLHQDWHRESGQDRMTINGQLLSTFDYNHFETDKDVEQFFDEAILKDLKNVSMEKKADIVAYLKTVFHQGGLMYPVSS